VDAADLDRVEAFTSSASSRCASGSVPWPTLRCLPCSASEVTVYRAL
jgi:hypothetical protein